MNSVSVVICTHNPEKEVFERCLVAVKSLLIPEGIKVQCTIVDNNSTPPVRKIEYVKELINETEWITIIEEKRPGQSNARETGCRKSFGDWIVFFDDDNEPNANYLLNLCELCQTHPDVGLWGPGNINVEYLIPVSDWFEKNKHYYQQRNYTSILIDDDIVMKYFYPPGTGMCVLRAPLEKWADKFNSGIYTVVGRTAGNLESSDDIQILYKVLEDGYKVGSSPTLSLNHLTSARKSTFSYIKRLAFGISVSGPRLSREISATPENFDVTLESPAKIIWKLCLFFTKYGLIGNKKKNNFLIAYIHYFAGIVGKYRLKDKKLPFALEYFIRKFDLEKR